MEFMPYVVPTNFCCIIVAKTKTDISTLQQEIERLSNLEEECNKKLDEFYASKQEFEFMLRNVTNKRYIDGLDTDDVACELIDEFSDYVTTTWQLGAEKLAQAQRQLQYSSMVDGVPLSVYIQSLQNNIERGSLSIAQAVCHPFCASLFYSLYTEITSDLFVRLSTADICLRQYEYLKKSLPFLEKLKDFTIKYTRLDTVCSIKQFSEEIISGISLNVLGDETKDDTENLGAFRHVVNLLTGKLFGMVDILDHHSEVQPCVWDRTHPRKKTIVRNLVEHFLKQELESLQSSVQGVQSDICCDTNAYLPFVEANTLLVNVNDPFNQYGDVGYQLAPYESVPQYLSTGYFNQGTSNVPMDLMFYRSKYEDGNNPKYTPGRRGRKPSVPDDSMDFNLDLKPIKIPKLKQDLIKPLT